MSDEDQLSGASETGSQFDPDMELEDDEYDYKHFFVYFRFT